jgi:hypothetical protein
MLEPGKGRRPVLRTDLRSAAEARCDRRAGAHDERRDERRVGEPCEAHEQMGSEGPAGEVVVDRDLGLGAWSCQALPRTAAHHPLAVRGQHGGRPIGADAHDRAGAEPDVLDRRHRHVVDGTADALRAARCPAGHRTRAVSTRNPMPVSSSATPMTIANVATLSAK